jgi:Ran GTPase-activating protein (RanGAP) involved in mRNA processing and transport
MSQHPPESNAHGDDARGGIPEWESISKETRERVEQRLARFVPNEPGLLDLSYCGLDSDSIQSLLHHASGRLGGVVKLNLSKNRIGDAGVQALAAEFEHLPALAELDLGGNEIGAAGAQALAAGFVHLPALASLDLGGNVIRAAGAQALAAGFVHLPALASLDLGGNEIGAGAQALAAGFVHLPALASLDLGGNWIGAAGAQALAAGFVHLPALASLELGYNEIGAAGAQALAAEFVHLPALASLDLGDNWIYDAGAKALAAEFEHLPALASLGLGGNRIGAAGAQALAAEFEHLPALASLDLGRNQIGDAGVQALAAEFEHLPALVSVNLERNGIDDRGAQALAAEFVHLPALASLDLGGNEIGAAGAQALAAGFVHLPALASLDLGRNWIGDAGVQALAAEFEHLPALAELDLGGNVIGAAGAQALAAEFEHLPALVSVNLERNGIDDRGAQALAAEFVHLPALASLDLGDNQIGDAGAQALAAEFVHLPALASLDLESNGIENAAAIVALIDELMPKGKADGRLRKLDVSGNNLKTRDGKEVEAAGLSTTDPQALRAYLASVLQAEQGGTAVTVPEARLVFIGVGENGKTQLARALGGKCKKGQSVPSEDRTKGIEVTSCTFEPTRFGQLKVRIFDSGGQPEQYAIHHLFWESLRNVMVLVLDSTKSWEWSGNRGDYFLRMIESHFGPGGGANTATPKPPPVLVVLTKAGVPTEQRLTPEWVKNKAKEYEGKLNVIVFDKIVDGVSHSGLDELRDCIKDALETAHGIDAVVPPAFERVRKAVQDNFGSFDHPIPECRMMKMEVYDRICEGSDQADQKAIYLLIMHALGDVLYVKDIEGRLSGKVINIHWACGALFKVLTDSQLIWKRGLMAERDWPRLFPGQNGVPDDAANLLKDVAVELKILWKVERDLRVGATPRSADWLVPELLQVKEDPHDWVERDPYQTVACGRFLPESVFLHFVGKHQQFIHARQASLFRDEAVFTRTDGVKALIRPDYTGDEHSIKIWADPNDLTKSQEWCNQLRTYLEPSWMPPLRIVEVPHSDLKPPERFPHPDWDSTEALEHLHIGIAHYRKQQTVRFWQQFAVISLAGLVALQLIVLPEKQWLGVLFAVVGSILAFSQVVLDSWLAEHRQVAATSFENLEKILLEGKRTRRDDDRYHSIAKGKEIAGDASPENWFVNISGLNVNTAAPLIMARQEAMFRAREHLIAMSCAVVFGALFVVAPFLLVWGLTSDKLMQVQVGYLTFVPLAVAGFVTAKQNSSAHKAFQAVEEQCKRAYEVYKSKPDAEGVLWDEGMQALKNLQHARQAHAPVPYWLYKSLCDESNRRAAGFVKRFNCESPLKSSKPD